jgi:hypothetical protein
MEQAQLTRRELLVATGTAGLAALGVTTPLDAGPASNYKNKVLAKMPVAYWRLGEAHGPTVLDSTGHGHTGTAHGAPVFHQPGAITGDPDTAIKLSGHASYIEVPDHKAFSQPTSGHGLTVEVWVRPDVLEFQGVPGHDYIHWLGKGVQDQSHQDEWALRFYRRTPTAEPSVHRPNRISAYIFNPASGLGAGAYFEETLTAGQWIHVVACYDPGDAQSPGKPGVSIYRDGVLKQGPTLPNPGPNPNPTHYKSYCIMPAHGVVPLRLGTQNTKGFLTGGLDEVAIYPRVLSASEILENYRAGHRG